MNYMHTTLTEMSSSDKAAQDAYLARERQDRRAAAAARESEQAGGATAAADMDQVRGMAMLASIVKMHNDQVTGSRAAAPARASSQAGTDKSEGDAAAIRLVQDRFIAAVRAANSECQGR
jgi:hypothetical protein